MARDLKERFFEKVYPEPNIGCWLWAGACDSKGYGQLHNKLKPRSAHRISYFIHFGSFPIELDILHKCDNSYCVNPDHLYAGTHQQNMDDMAARGGRNPLYGEQHPLSKLKVENVIEIKKGLPLLEAMKKFGIGKQAVRNILNNVTWKHVKI